ncbi:hypothetical protein QJS10_CPA09g00794 [Acorus calamus]|uniref:Uncharacterized protein n=1 Tax=Acorus calamus TaxID=4465 RepID=A0AAV9E711_ACOCL|nr:hypothetical protein QJS10_CPA09g00794 [Acorus calamus]
MKMFWERRTFMPHLSSLCYLGDMASKPHRTSFNASRKHRAILWTVSVMTSKEC